MRPHVSLKSTNDYDEFEAVQQEPLLKEAGCRVRGHSLASCLPRGSSDRRLIAENAEEEAMAYLEHFRTSLAFLKRPLAGIGSFHVGSKVSVLHVRASLGRA